MFDKGNVAEFLCSGFKKLKLQYQLDEVYTDVRVWVVV